MTSLPPELFELVEFTPLEDIVLHHLRAAIPPPIRVGSLVATDQEFPFILVRRTPDWGRWAGDGKFIDAGQITVHSYCEGVNADTDCAFLGDAVRTTLRDAVNVPVSGIGWLTEVEMIQPPRRASDWATATGPVQYADLPEGVVRYEAIFQLVMRAKRA